MVLAACSSKSETKRVRDDAASAPVVVDAVKAVDARPARKVFVTGAGRCGECHGKMYDEWETSAHAKAVTSPLYKAARASSKTAAIGDTTCDRCHAALGAEGGAVTSEGVTCDVCHTLRDPAPGPDGAGFRLAIDDMVKFGPRCNLKDHYFHRMGCSPEHDKAIICGTCHLWEPNGIPVFTEYKDYRDSPAAARGEQCQSCHMPKERAPLATGSPARDGVPHHGLLGITSDLRKRALELAVEAADNAGALAVTVKLSNVSAGHYVPSGLPERRIVVRVHVGDETQVRALGRVLVDASGAEVPFWKATKVGSDSRIAPGGEWHETFKLHPPADGAIEIDVMYRAVSESVAKQLAVADVEEQPLIHAVLAHGVKTLTVKPKPPGRRAP